MQSIFFLKQDYEEARSCYAASIERMEKRGADNPFILYGYSIFLAVTQEEDWIVIKEYVFRARLAEKNWRKRHVQEKKSIYELPCAGFYRHSAFVDQSAESWHNYALCLMLAFNDLLGARDAFVYALEKSPHSKFVIANFNFLLQDSEFLGSKRPLDWTIFDEVNQIKQQHIRC